jgi:hypothetical protein
MRLEQGMDERGLHAHGGKAIHLLLVAVHSQHIINAAILQQQQQQDNISTTWRKMKLRVSCQAGTAAVGIHPELPGSRADLRNALATVCSQYCCRS